MSSRIPWCVVAALLLAGRAAAHPAPFSYFDVALTPDGIEVALVAHDLDLAHELKLGRAEALLERATAESRAPALVAILGPRFRLEVDGRPLTCVSSDPVEVLAERQSLRFRFACPVERAGAFTLHAFMFPYDPVHQTFVNVYDHGTLATQAILGEGRQSVEYFSGTREGVAAVVRRFVPAGVHHILIGPDHLLFLVGLLLLGGSMKRLLLVVTAFTVAHSLTLSLAALDLVTPPPGLVEPAIALSIVYVGADNLMVRDRPGRDMRPWIALTFGLIHGFGFASVLREMDLPPRALGWSLFSFNVGVEIGQAFVVVAAGAALAALRWRSQAIGRHVVLVGSLVVMAAGAFWFVERVFF